MKRILIAEDRAASRELIRTVLEAAGYEILEAADGEEALEKAAEERVDLVLVDLQMPKIDGFGVVAGLRAEPRFADIPIVALTASAMRGDRERALAAGFSAHIAKPIDIVGLRAQIKSLLGG
jgi:two-component system, cell cycle response regulator DivK